MEVKWAALELRTEARMRWEDQGQFRKGQLAAAMEAMCERLELSELRHEQARQRYEGVGIWLSGSPHPALRSLLIYVQGSTAIGTTVRPIGSNEHDVDLIAFLGHSARGYEPSQVKRLIGDRLRENGRYAPLLTEKCRCWRLGYANEFHLDITPSIPNPSCANGGELVPDKELRCWKGSNPKGYKELFERRARLQPRFRLAKLDGSFAEGRAAASVEPYPDHGGFKGVLRRAVQISKRHRDVHFSKDATLAPISVIVTTLLSRSYEACVREREYDTGLDLLVDVVRRMPATIEYVGGRWAIWNETTQGENFAERWNGKPALAVAFFEWHDKLLGDLERLTSLLGLDRIVKGIQDSFGDEGAQAAMARLDEAVSRPRAAGALSYAPRVGLGAGVGASSTPVLSNTFYGR